MPRPRKVHTADDPAIIEVRDIYTPYRLTQSRWNEVALKGWYSPTALMTHEYRRMISPYAPYELGWLTLSGQQLGSQMIDFLDLELAAYKVFKRTAFDCAYRQLDWALAFASLPTDEHDHALANRPVSAAELLGEQSFKLLGLVNPMGFVSPSSRHGAFYPVIKMPVNPEPETATRPFIIDCHKAQSLIERANAFDRFADQIEQEFYRVEDKFKQLTSARKLRLKPFLHKTKYFDPELISDANIALAGGLFYRARSLADFLRKMVYTNVM
jgi:hypothetical protein